MSSPDQPMQLRVDPARADYPNTGYPVRAQAPDGKWVDADVMHLDKISLHTWLRSRGGDNPWAESFVLGLLGHE